jgi:serine/threonine protein kinase
MGRIHYDDYEIGDTIGVGTVGTIYRVQHRASRNVFALKLLSPAVSTDEQIVARFKREMMILSKLNHPNIVAYYGGGEHEKRLFYVMELIEGGTLKQILKASGPFSWEETAECGRQIASALQHAHNHGIIHRDLKPGNVFLTENGQLKLGDFGVARDLRETHLTDVGLTVGTYAYMAPELIRGQREITGQVDLYALGCLLYEMLTGRTPYVGDNFAQIFEQHLNSKPIPLADLGIDCPPAMEQLIQQLLAKSPDDRPFNARTVQGILGEMCERPDKTSDGADEHDRAAMDVHPIQLSLMHRIKNSQESRDVSWRTVAVLGIGIIAAIVVVIVYSIQ